MSKTVSAELTGAGSHYVDIDHRGLNKEEVFLTFATTWRGTPAVVQMSADQYRHSSGMSEWRIYAQRAVEGGDAHAFGRHLTDTARSRLSEQLRPLVEEWLTTDDYAVSRRQAVARAIQRELHERSYSDPPSRRVREKLTMVADSLSPGQVEAIGVACDLLDAFEAAVEAVEQA